MACYHPWRKSEGGVVSRPFSCGKCHGCQLEWSRQWAVRCVHEASLYDENCFITLTFKDAIWSLDHKYFQDFMKRLRFKFRPRRIGYFMSGEYGEETSRAHFHSILFNFSFWDREYLKMSSSGNKLYTSAMLEKLWTFGHSSVANVTFESCAYVARAHMKKLAWKGVELHEILDPETGEVFRREPEYVEMSRRPAIGRNWIKQFKGDVYPTGKVLVNGVQSRAPRYYDKWLRSTSAGEYMRLCVKRAAELPPDTLEESMPERLIARETVSKARVGLSKKTL